MLQGVRRSPSDCPVDPKTFISSERFVGDPPPSLILMRQDIGPELSRKVGWLLTIAGIALLLVGAMGLSSLNFDLFGSNCSLWA